MCTAEKSSNAQVSITRRRKRCQRASFSTRTHAISLSLQWCVRRFQVFCLFCSCRQPASQHGLFLSDYAIVSTSKGSQKNAPLREALTRASREQADDVQEIVEELMQTRLDASCTLHLVGGATDRNISHTTRVRCTPFFPYTPEYDSNSAKKRTREPPYHTRCTLHAPSELWHPILLL